MMKRYADDLMAVRTQAQRAACQGILSRRFQSLDALFDTCAEMATTYPFPRRAAEQMAREAVDTYLHTRRSLKQEAAA